MNLERQVEGVGPKRADIMLIGEAPGRDEVLNGEPFWSTAFAGSFLRDMVRRAGLAWDDIRVDNVVQRRPLKDSNDFSVFYKDSKLLVPTEELELWWQDLEERIYEVKPSVLIVTGDEPLMAVRGHKKILQWRGSPIEHQIDDHNFIIVPMVHPSFARRQYQMTSAKDKDTRQPWFNISVWDILKAKRIAAEGWNPKPRNEIIFPSYADVMGYLEELDSLPPDTPITVDIETLRREFIGCLGLTHKETEAMCIPFVASYDGRPYFSLMQEYEVLNKLKKVLESHLINGQTFGFDTAYIFKDFKIDIVDNFYIDTASLHALLYAELKHDLAFLVSLYTDLPHFKYIGRMSETKRDLRQWFEYNCQDVYATHEIAFKLKEEAITSKWAWDYYLQKRLKTIHWTFEQHRKGLLKDPKKTQELISKIEEEFLAPTEAAFNSALAKTGLEPVNTRSPQQVSSFLKTLGLDVESTNKKVLKKEELLLTETILNIRSWKSLIKDMESQPDEDGCFRTAITTYVTATGRLSSTKSHFGTGANLQNENPYVRPMFRARDGMLLAELDLSQAEARAVAFYCGDEGMKNLFKDKVDIHVDRACMILSVIGKGISYNDLLSSYRSGDAEADRFRQASKMVGVHATNYDVGSYTVIKTLRLYGIYLSMAQERELRERTHNRFPGIRAYQFGVQRQLAVSKTLTTALGFRRYFFSKLDQNTFRRAYAFMPQATVGEVINRGIYLRKQLKEEFETTILLQIHDSLLLEGPRDSIRDAIKFIKPHIEEPFMVVPFMGQIDYLSLPVETKIGTHWGELQKENL